MRTITLTGAIAISVDTPFLSGFPSPWASGGTEDSGWDWQEAHVKARAFVSNLTLPEKVNLTTGTGWEADVCIGMTGSVPRLGFRGFCLQDGPLGVRYSDHNSAFPAGINAAATWSRELMRKRGEAMGAEFRGKGVDVQLGPVAGPLGRNPQGGRNWEGFSPDPYLTGVAMAETVKGVQSKGVIACAKHFILNEQEHYRDRIDVKMDDRTMHELYLWPFADAVRAGVGSVMCSYNKINGEHTCENEWTTNYLLKNELGFQGFVVSDWGAQHTTLGSALGGLDMAMPGDGSLWGGALTEAVLRGDVPEWRLDDMAVRIMAAYFKVHTGSYADRPEVNFSAWTNKTVGLVHPSAKNGSEEAVVNEFVDVQGDHRDLIRQIGAKSIVLLKNERGLLPLSKPRSMAIFGDDARDNPDGPNACPDRACVRGTVAMGWGSGTAEFPYLVSPAAALRRRAELDDTYWFETIDSPLTAVQRLAGAADVAIVFAAADAGENFVTVDGNAGDRNNLTLWNGGDELIQAVASYQKNTIVVLHTPGSVNIEYARAHPNITAILWAGLPGQESGNALVDVLYGEVNPQGKLPFTWPKDESTFAGIPLMFNALDPLNPTQSFDEGLFIDYRWVEQYPQSQWRGVSWPFGYGLSYTAFEYSDLRVKIHNDNTPWYTANQGLTGDAPTYGKIDTAAEANTAPKGFKKITPYVYPWITTPTNNTNNTTARSAFPAAAYNGSAQPVHPAGGAPGGNKGLFEVLYTVTCEIRNVGDVPGTDIPQLYLRQHAGDDNTPFRVLRGFDEVALQPNETKTATFNLTRRDVSYWDTDSQNWVIDKWTSQEVGIESSGDLKLTARLRVGG
ncbi:putative glycoside hydrolase [Diplogelasinospora grovesii]|uniref:beta-glucosidase n=1 Tax=Diplogelasinospora grovesii TaxID=303347 RepID=A0AAN6NB71_9PEZI|nr:putative glycoside hydrolase [Diplogelasinospora grovesii]